jgi:hypothetical protein
MPAVLAFWKMSGLGPIARQSPIITDHNRSVRQHNHSCVDLSSHHGPERPQSTIRKTQRDGSISRAGAEPGVPLFLALKIKMVRAGDLNPHGACAPTDFLTLRLLPPGRKARPRNAPAGLWSGLYLHHGRSAGRCFPSSGLSQRFR